MKRYHIYITIFAAFSFFSCNKAGLVEETPGDIVSFQLRPGSEFFGAMTKAVTATSLTSFKCEATTGSAGSESSSWNNIVFTSDGAGTPTYKASPAKYWPLSNPNYNFYAVAATPGAAAATAAAAPDLIYAAAGSTITMAAAYDKDVICAYEPSSDITWKTKNTLAFEHIFARISTVNVTAVAPCAISNVTISLINPKTGGTYNLRTGHGQINATGWSSLVPADGSQQQLYRNTGNIASGANHTGSNNDFYIVPGTYKLKATWTASVDDYSQSYSDMVTEQTITIQKGKVNSISCSLSGDPEQIKFAVSVTPWGSKSISGLEFNHHEQVPTFGGLMIAPAPLYYSSVNGFEIKDDDWNHDSYNSVYGKNNGSYYFNFIELGSYFDADGNSFSTSSGSIDNTNKISYGGYDDWRVATQAEWSTITTGESPGVSRDGSTVNGNSGARYALIKLTGVTHAGSSTPNGLLLFPDGRTITGKALSGINNTTCTAEVSGTELQNYLDQGCAFLSASGSYYNGSWRYGASRCYFWTATERNSTNGYYALFYPTNVAAGYNISKSAYYFSVWLVRNSE